MIFPKWTNYVAPLLLFKAVAGLLVAVFVFWYWLSPENLEVGYQPQQPINYSHKLHAGELGIDCRYCHYTVAEAASAAIPPTEVCMNCHTLIKTNSAGESAEIKKISDSYENNEPIEWVKVHQLPDYVYFNHNRHINSGVSCVSCHGRVDQMEVVYQAKPLSMGWCLECHRNVEGNIRPKAFVTDLAWHDEDLDFITPDLIKAYGVAPREDCNTCHR